MLLIFLRQLLQFWSMISQSLHLLGIKKLLSCWGAPSCIGVTSFFLFWCFSCSNLYLLDLDLPPLFMWIEGWSRWLLVFQYSELCTGLRYWRIWHFVCSFLEKMRYVCHRVPCFIFYSLNSIKNSCTNMPMPCFNFYTNFSSISN